MSKTITSADWLELGLDSVNSGDPIEALPASDVAKIKVEIQEISRHQMSLRGLLEKSENEHTRFMLVKEMALARSYLRYLKKVHDFRLRFTERPLKENLIPLRYTSQLGDSTDPRQQPSLPRPKKSARKTEPDRSSPEL